MIMNIICFILGANTSLFLYACILVGKKADKNFIETEKYSE